MSRLPQTDEEKRVSQLKVFVHNFIGIDLKEFDRNNHITKQKEFDEIPLTADIGISQLASHFDEATSDHAIIDHTNLSGHESPEIKQMPHSIFDLPTSVSQQGSIRQQC